MDIKLYILIGFAVILVGIIELLVFWSWYILKRREDCPGRGVNLLYGIHLSLLGIAILGLIFYWIFPSSATAAIKTLGQTLTVTIGHIIALAWIMPGITLSSLQQKQLKFKKH